MAVFEQLDDLLADRVGVVEADLAQTAQLDKLDNVLLMLAATPLARPLPGLRLGAVVAPWQAAPRLAAASLCPCSVWR
jgi:hypothetical protein